MGSLSWVLGSIVIAVACSPEDSGSAPAALGGASSTGGSGGLTSGASSGGSAGIASGSSGGSSGKPSAGGNTLPDGTSCAPAPADAPGAAEAWQRFLDWQGANAERCGISDTWQSYECFSRVADPRRIAAFTACMMADDCNTISDEDRCLYRPNSVPGAHDEPTGEALAWFENVCNPKHEECGFSDDNCGVFSEVVRPEVRCAIMECVEGPCAGFEPCMQALRERFEICPNAG